MKQATEQRLRDVPAVTKALAILRHLGSANSPATLSQISKDLRIVPSTCLHILRILLAEEVVGFDPDSKRYFLDAGLLRLARSLLRPGSFSRRIQSELDSLAAQFPITAVAVRIVGVEHATVVAISYRSLPRTLNVEVGTRIPALLSASGRCLAAFGSYSLEEIDNGFEALRWDRPPTLSEWHDQIAATRAKGYAIDRGNYISGVTVIAAPVMVDGSMSHALAAVGVSEQIDRFGEESVGAAVMARANRVSEQQAGDHVFSRER